ncbi:MAG: hypothetical protein U1F66_04405 [bacterium]
MTYGSGGPGNLILSPAEWRHRPDPTEGFAPAAAVRELFGALGGRQAIQQRIGPALLTELESLAREDCAELFFEALLHIAERLTQAQPSETGTLLLQYIAGANRDGPVGGRAQRRLDAVLGRGDAWARAEFLGRHFAREASDPATLAAMGLAGTVFRMTRLAVLGRLAALPGENFLTRGLIPRLLAGGAGLLAEVPSFTFGHHGVAAALGREVDWSPRALGGDLASGALTLLGLRAMGGLSGLALRRWAGGAGLGAEALRLLIPQAGMFAGILLSRNLEERLGLRQGRPGATRFTDALATLLQFNVGGRLSQQALGEGMQLREGALEQRTTALEWLNTAQPRESQGSVGRPRWRWAPAVTALGLGLHTLLNAGTAWAQDRSGFGGMHMIDPTLIGMLVATLGVPAAYGIKRAYDYLRGNPSPSPEFFSRHRARLIEGKGGPAPTDVALPGEEALIADRLAALQVDPLYLTIQPQELESALRGEIASGQGVFRTGAIHMVRRVGPRVFELGIQADTGELSRILELTQPLPQVPPPPARPGEFFLRVAKLIDLQQYADLEQRPVLALPLTETSEYFLGIPLQYQDGAGYVSPLFRPGFRGLNTESHPILERLGLSLSPKSNRSASRGFLLENDGRGYLIMDQEGAQVEVVPSAWQQKIAREGARVNGRVMAGSHPSLPLTSGDTLQAGGLEIRFLAPRSGFRLALIRHFYPPRNPDAEEPLGVGSGNEVDRMAEGAMENHRPWLPRFEPDSILRQLSKSSLRRLQEVLIAARLRLPDLLFEAPDGARILLSPRLLDGRSVPVGLNPGLGGIFLHGAWNPGGARYPIVGAEVEFFLQQREDAFWVKRAPGSSLRLYRQENEIPLENGAEASLQDHDILEFGPPEQRTRLRWFRDFDAMTEGEE